MNFSYKVILADLLSGIAGVVYVNLFYAFFKVGWMDGNGKFKK